MGDDAMVDGAMGNEIWCNGEWGVGQWGMGQVGSKSHKGTVIINYMRSISNDNFYYSHDEEPLVL